MIQILISIWAKYRLLTWWQKGLLFLPLIIIAVLCFALFFVKKEPRADLIADQIEYQKKVVDKQLKKIDKREAKLKAKSEDLKGKRDNLQKEIEDHEKEIKDLSSDIDRAAHTGDVKQLRSIHRKLRERAKRLKH